ncbi:NAD(P)/FAD-dependent oxidoreductase [Aquisalibacillus elongatus]|uniref:D-amino acid dehydrogenase small subunit n=1 Tax=Aquisalibacillus elongatus TaxID=485577 RepID=A0A3N5B040_9BACI|nr:FAD-binding oxidoreductase [Aquisalibacillus elongatus]RPF50627.1 D-amino acid dehydrogenase small subunit [Aquisalibacillus elongatus]
MSFVIIGGGILGASTAYHLALAGEDVTIIDRKDLGQATDAAAGIVCPWLSQRRNKKWYRMVKGGARYYPELVEKLKVDGETDVGYKRVGTISLHTDPTKLDQMVERAKKRREDAPEIGEIKRLSSEESQAYFPLLSDEYEAVYVSGGARVDGRAMRDALLRAAQKRGANVIQGSAEILTESNRVVGVNVNDQTIFADKVLDTSGAWAKQLMEPLGINFHVTHQRAQIIHLDLQNMNTSEWPVVMPPNNSYLLSFDEGRMVVGATRTDEVEFDYRTTTGAIHEILGKALEVAPGLDNSTFVETRVGFRPYTPGYLPIIGAVPHIDQLLVANGLGASGLTSGPYLGAELARLARKEETELDIQDYDVSQALE